MIMMKDVDDDDENNDDYGGDRNSNADDETQKGITKILVIK